MTQKYIDKDPAVALNCNPNMSQVHAWRNKSLEAYSIEQILGVSTTDATPTSLTTNGLAADLNNTLNLWDALVQDPGALPDQMLAMRVTVTGRKDGTADAVIFTQDVGVALRNQAPYATNILGPGPQSRMDTATPLTGTAMALSIGTIPASGVDHLDIKVTGLAATAITWRAKVALLGSV